MSYLNSQQYEDGVALDSVFNNEMFYCYKCCKRYNSRRAKMQHSKYECGKIPKNLCPYCSYRSHRTYNLKKHIKSKHDGIPPL